MLARMIIISVIYPKTDESHFDHGYYLERHIPLVKKRWAAHGLVRVELVRGVSAMDGGACSFELLGMLSFGSREEMQGALAAYGAEVMGDIPNFTNVQPVLQINEPVQG